MLLYGKSQVFLGVEQWRIAPYNSGRRFICSEQGRRRDGQYNCCSSQEWVNVVYLLISGLGNPIGVYASVNVGAFRFLGEAL
jgi:hypothetical protein